MISDFKSLIFIWLLPLAGCSTVTPSWTAETRNPQLASQNESTLSAPRDVSDHQPATTERKEEISIPIRSSTSPNIQAAATPNYYPSSQFNSSTLDTLSTTDSSSRVNSSTLDTKNTMEVMTSLPTAVTSQVSNQTSRLPSTPMTSAQSQRTGQTSQFTSDEISHPSTHPTWSTNFISTLTMSTKPAEKKVTSENPDTVQSTGLYKTSLATTKKPFIHAEVTKTPTPSEKKAKRPGAIHGNIVAGIIGGAIIMMMVGFLAIYLKKRKLHKQQMSTTEWAGPSPFLEGGANNGQVALRSSNQISLSSFLPQRLSKRFSLLPEADEELEEIIPATTFNNKHQEASFAQDVAENDEKKRNGTAAGVPEMKTTEDTPETVGNLASESSSPTDKPPSANNDSKVTNLSQVQPATPPSPSGVAENGVA